MFVSHAQNFEDVMLWRALKHIKNGFYVDAGAQDPYIDSVTLAFYERGWRGVHIEPMRDYAEKLKLARKDEIVLEVALSDNTGLINFYEIPNTGLSTISADIAAKHANTGFQSICRQVPCAPLSEILENYSGKDVHFLKIDVEGHEEAVIRGNDWKAYRPWIVVVEATLPNSQTESYDEWEYMLLGSDYQFVYADGLNRFFVAKEHDSLSKFFRYPPNTFDGFISARQAALKVRAQELELKAEQADIHIVRADIRYRQSEEQADLLMARAKEAEDIAAQAEVRAKEAEDIAAQAEVRAKEAEDIAAQAEVRAKEAEDIAAQAEVRAAQAEARLKHFYVRATDAEARAEAIETSLSWRLTRSLRRYNPQHLILPSVRRIVGGLRNAPPVSQRTEELLVEGRNLNGASILSASKLSPDNSYIGLNLSGIRIYFSKEALEDSRGIGRVSREILNELKSVDVSRFDSKNEDFVYKNAEKRPIYFFSSIHWCPDNLPQPSVIMIHDIIPLLFPNHFPDVVKNWTSRYVAIAKQASVIVTISQSSAEDISNVIGVPKQKIKVIYNGVTQHPVPEKPVLKIPFSSYVVYLGSHDYHKNPDIVFQALADARLKNLSLVMVGDNKECLPSVRKLGLEGRVHFAGRLHDADVGDIVSRALALVFPSIYEGFGLPPLEAALLGTPSVCSRRPAMTELLENAALFAEPDDPHEWAECLWRLFDEPKFRQDLGERAFNRAQWFTWERAGSHLREILMAVANESDLATETAFLPNWRSPS